MKHSTAPPGPVQPGCWQQVEKALWHSPQISLGSSGVVVVFQSYADGCRVAVAYSLELTPVHIGLSGILYSSCRMMARGLLPSKVCVPATCWFPDLIGFRNTPKNTPKNSLALGFCTRKVPLSKCNKLAAVTRWSCGVVVVSMLRS